MDLKRSIAVVTGAARGIGRQAAVVLAQRCAGVALIDVDAPMLAETKAACDEFCSRVMVYPCNVASEAEVVATFSQIGRDLGTAAVLFNNAGITRDALLLGLENGHVTRRMSLEQWQAVIDVNLTGVFLCGREAATHMVEAGRSGVIVNVSSISRLGNIGQTNYAAAKAGVAAITVVWAREMARYGIRVAAIAPGFVDTDLLNSMKPQARERALGLVPVQRAGRVDEIAHALLFVLENDYFNGRVLEIDGGLRI